MAMKKAAKRVPTKKPVRKTTKGRAVICRVVPTTEHVMTEIAVAFGRGAGLTAMSAEAAAWGWDHFSAQVEANRVKYWRVDRKHVIDSATAMGQLAAGYAAAEGTAEISLAHFKKAAGVVHTASAKAMRKRQRRRVRALAALYQPTHFC